MKVTLYFILSGENLFHPHYFKGVLDNLPKNIYRVAGVTILKENYKKGLLYFLWQQVNLWGTIGLLYIAAHSLIRILLAKAGFKNLTVESISESFRIPIIYIERVNEAKHLDYLKRRKIDIVISSCGQIFKSKLLKLPKIACINRHSALLPKYGGVMPVFWAMHHNEKEFGVSMHYMVEEIDKGDIIYRETIPIEKGNSLFRNYLFAFDKSIVATINALDFISKRKIVGKFKNNNKAYFSFPNFSVISDFKKNHKTFSLSDIFFYHKTF